MFNEGGTFTGILVWRPLSELACATVLLLAGDLTVFWASEPGVTLGVLPSPPESNGDCCCVDSMLNETERAFLGLCKLFSQSSAVSTTRSPPNVSRKKSLKASSLAQARVFSNPSPLHVGF